MVPAASHPTWAKLIRGEVDHQFTKAAASMLLFNLRLQHKESPAKLTQHVDEARKFFEKYENVLADDIRKLFR